MKIKKEIVEMPEGQSFKLFQPRLRNYFFWHYHPEFELVYVEATTGIRHVGQHISSFMGSDLVFWRKGAAQRAAAVLRRDEPWPG